MEILTERERNHVRDQKGDVGVWTAGERKKTDSESKEYEEKKK